MKQPRKGSNLAQSLGRIAHVKGKTVAWLKGFDKMCQKDAPVSVSIATSPSAYTLRPVTCTASSTSVTLRSPLQEYGGTLSYCLPVYLTCSFCQDQVRGVEYGVSYNPMLPVPFVVTCCSCAKKPGMM